MGKRGSRRPGRTIFASPGQAPVSARDLRKGGARDEPGSRADDDELCIGGMCSRDASSALPADAQSPGFLAGPLAVADKSPRVRAVASR